MLFSSRRRLDASLRFFAGLGLFFLQRCGSLAHESGPKEELKKEAFFFLSLPSPSSRCPVLASSLFDFFSSRPLLLLLQGL